MLDLAPQKIRQENGTGAIQSGLPQPFIHGFAPFRPILDLFQQDPDFFGQMKITVHFFSPPEGRCRCLCAGWQHKNRVAGNPLDAPVLGAQGKNLPRSGLPDELLVQFANTCTARFMAQSEIAPVGNHAAGGVDGEQGAFSGTDRIAQPVDDNPGRQRGDAGSGVSAGQHLDDQIKMATAQTMKRCRGAQFAKQTVDVPRRHPDHGYQHLRENIQGCVNELQRLQLTCQYRLGQGRGNDPINGVRGEECGPAMLPTPCPERPIR